MPLSVRLNKSTLLLRLLFLSLLLGGCSHQALMDADLNDELNAARSNGDYVKALRVIDRAPSEHPQYELIQQQREPLLKEIDRYQQQQIKEANNLVRSGRWQEALDLIRDVKKQWRDSPALIEAEQSLFARQQLRLHQLHADLLVAEADWLATQHERTNQLEALADRQAEKLAREVRYRQNNVAEEMALLGQFFAEQQDWQRTRALLDGERKLRGSTERGPLLLEAEKKLAGVAHRREQASSQRAREQARVLIDAYRQSSAINDLVKARDYLQKNNLDGALDEMASDLEVLCRKQFNKGLRDGDSLYAAGRYQQAKKVWLEVSPLYPGDNELAGKIERVQRVLDSLESLKK